jgi:HAMP domain-containing protein
LYLLNPEGRVLMNTGRIVDQVGTQEDRSDEPIVRQLLTGRLDNGSRRYLYRGNEYLASFQVVDFGGLGIVSRVPAARAFEAVLQLQRRNILIMIMVLSIAFLFLYFFARGLNVPIRALVQATRQIESGNYRVDVRPSSRDEIGLLTTSFRSMARGLEERERLRGEMDVARRIQTALLPERERIGPCSVAAIMQPAEEVGGDYYDLIETAAGETWASSGARTFTATFRPKADSSPTKRRLMRPPPSSRSMVWVEPSAA